MSLLKTKPPARLLSDRSRRSGNKRVRRLVALVLAALGLVLVMVAALRQLNIGAANRLPAAGAGVVVPVNLPKPDQSWSSLEEIYALRRNYFLTLPEALRVDYHPLKRIFEAGGGVDLPFESMSDYFVFGGSRPYKPGAPAAALALANPLLLIDFNFDSFSIGNKDNFVWASYKINNERLDEDFPYRPLPQDLVLTPGERRAEVTYDLSAYLKTTARFTVKQPPPEDIFISTILFNAADFGFKTVGLAENSWRIAVKNLSPQPLISMVIPVSGPCSAKGCNRIVGTIMVLSIEQLPAVGVFNLWLDREAAGKKPDFVYTVNFR